MSPPGALSVAAIAGDGALAGQRQHACVLEREPAVQREPDVVLVGHFIVVRVAFAQPLQLAQPPCAHLDETDDVGVLAGHQAKEPLVVAIRVVDVGDEEPHVRSLPSVGRGRRSKYHGTTRQSAIAASARPARAGTGVAATRTVRRRRGMRRRSAPGKFDRLSSSANGPWNCAPANARPSRAANSREQHRASRRRPRTRIAVPVSGRRSVRVHPRALRPCWQFPIVFHSLGAWADSRSSSPAVLRSAAICASRSSCRPISIAVAGSSRSASRSGDALFAAIRSTPGMPASATAHAQVIDRLRHDDSSIVKGAFHQPNALAAHPQELRLSSGQPRPKACSTTFESPSDCTVQ